ncbi:MAG: hypothetical protein IJI54_02310 [Kiritimatiellae bacterium]|nr:hypothetical protein [Kiritimatiellia bacterium]
MPHKTEYATCLPPSGLKRLVATCYKSHDVDLFSQGDCERAICQIYEGDKNGNMTMDDDEIGVRELKGDGDFRSAECIEILKEADVRASTETQSLHDRWMGWRGRRRGAVRRGASETGD